MALTIIPLACSRAFSGSGHCVDLILKIGLGTLFGMGAAYLIYSIGLAQSVSWVRENTLWLLSGLFAMSMGAWIGLGLFVALIAGLYFKFRYIGIKGLYTRVISTTLHYRWTTIVVSVLILFGGIHIFTKIKVQRYRYQPDRMVASSN